jgi:epoxyqueuosine reductase
VQKRRRHETESAAGHVDLVAWLEEDGAALVASFDRLYVPRNDARFLRRNALVALGNTAHDDISGSEHRDLLLRYAEGDDELLADHARWALERR